MKQETYKRVLEIQNRLDALQAVLNEVSPASTHRLNYVDNDNKGCAEWKMEAIGKLLDHHDEIIRKEIEHEIAALHAEIETL